MKAAPGASVGPMRRISNHRFVALARATIALMLAGAACSRTDDRPAVWTYVSAELFQPNCATASCHSRGRAVAGLDFSDPDRGYKSLTGLKIWIPDPDGTIGGDCKTVGATVYCERYRPLVLAFNPEQSRLVNMLRARAAPRMPPDRPLSEADIQPDRNLDSRRRARDAGRGARRVAESGRRRSGRRWCRGPSGRQLRRRQLRTRIGRRRRRALTIGSPVRSEAARRYAREQREIAVDHALGEATAGSRGAHRTRPSTAPPG